MTFDGTGRGVDCHCRCGVEIVAGPGEGNPGISVADAPEHEVGLRIIVTSDPRGGSTGFPIVAAPGVAPRLAGLRSHVGFPHLFPCFGIVGSDEPSIRTITTGNSGDELAIGHKRRRRHVLADRVVADDRSPDFLACLCLERDEHGFREDDEHFVAVKRDTAIHRLAAHVARRFAAIAPQDGTRFRVQREHLVERARNEHHAAVDDRRRLVAVVHARRERPHRLQALHVAGIDLVERAVAPSIVRAPRHQPIRCRRVLQPIGRDRAVFLQQRGRRRRRRLFRNAQARIGAKRSRGLRGGLRPHERGRQQTEYQREM